VVKRVIFLTRIRLQLATYFGSPYRQFAGKHCETSIAIPAQHPRPKISVKNYMSRIYRCWCRLGYFLTRYAHLKAHLRIKKLKTIIAWRVSEAQGSRACQAIPYLGLKAFS
jgi:hypothetical protein